MARLGNRVSPILFDLPSSFRTFFKQSFARLDEKSTIVVLTIFFSLFSLPLMAQVVTPGTQVGTPTFGTFHGGDIDTVSLQNLNLHIEIPILSVPERGGRTLSWKYVYDTPSFSGTWVSAPTPTNPAAGFYRIAASTVTSGWRLVNSTNWELVASTVSVTCTVTNPVTGTPQTFTENYRDNFNVVDPAGTQHPVPLRVLVPPAGGVTHCVSQQNFKATTSDGSGINVDVSSATPVIRLKDGTTGIVSSAFEGTGPVTAWEDSNGNEFSNTKDMLGRSNLLTVVDTGSAATLTYNDSNGHAQPIQIAYTTASGTTADCGLLVFARGTCNEGGYSSRELASITLSDGRIYTFSYVGNTHGEITAITLPSGGNIQYSYAMKYFEDFPVEENAAHALNFTGRPQVSQRVVSDGSSSSTWQYQQVAGGIKVINPMLDYEVHQLGQISIGGQTAQSSIPYETSISTFDSSGNLVKTMNIDYTADIGTMGSGFQQNDVNILVNVRPIRETTVLENGMTSKKETDYDTTVQAGFNISRLNKVEERFYDFAQSAPGPLLKRIHYTYLHDVNSAYLTPNIVDRVTQIDTYDGSGNHVAEVVNQYDNYSQGITASGATQHDSTFGASFALRGNLTAVSRWRNTDGALITNSYKYDDAGNTIAETDPSSNTTSYDYSDAWTEASCLPVNGPAIAYLHKITDAMGHTQTFSHYSCTALLGSATDQNQLATSYSYDLMGRLTLTQYADGGQETAIYQPTPPQSVTEKTLIQAVPQVFKTTTTFFDGLGRVKQTQASDDSSTVDTVDTTYDANGRVFCVSNAYRVAGEPTSGNKCTSYDPLNRITQVSDPDGSSRSTTYSGNTSTSSDEVGNQRKSFVDGLGRLIEVDEPGPTLTAPTPSHGSVTITGTLQSKVQTTAASSGSFSGFNIQPISPYPTVTFDPCAGHAAPCPRTIPDSGTVSITIAGFTAATGYDNTSTSTSLLQNLANSFNVASSPVTATPSLTLTAKATGAATNYTFTTSVTFDHSTCPSGPCFSGPGVTMSPTSGVMTGGVDGGSSTIYDHGQCWITVQGQQIFGHPWSSANTTTATIAADLASAVQASSTFVNATNTAGTPTINLTTQQGGATTNYPVSSGCNFDSTDFSTASFGTSIIPLNGGADGQPGPYSLSAPFVTLYTYDALDNLLTVTQKGSAPTDSTKWRNRSFVYDSLSELLSATNPETGKISYTYDSNSNLKTRTDAKATVTTYTYDGLNRLTQKSYASVPPNPGTPTIKYGYDGIALTGCTIAQPVLTDSYPVGRRTDMCDGSGSTGWTHDQMGRILIKKQKIGSTFFQATTYTYNPDGTVKTETYPTSHVLSYGYDSLARPISITDTTSSISHMSACTTRPCYGPNGALTQIKLSSGITVSNTYNKRFQPSLMSATGPQGTILSLNYDFHAGSGDNGDVYKITNNKDNNRSQNFIYDPLNRIQQAFTTGPNWGETFTIDAWGNLTTRAGVSGKTNFEQLDGAASAVNQLSTLNYDAAGDVTAYGSTAFTYDAENRILSSSTSGVTTNYTYDGDGNRVMKSNGATGTIYWMDAGGETIDEGNLSDVMQEEYVYVNGRRIVRWDVPTGHRHYYFGDALGSSNVVTSDAGVIQDESDYFPFGGETQIVNTYTNTYKFTGKERDAESGLDEFGARYYSSGSGRFMSPDPLMASAHSLNPQTWNRYAYALNNPLVFTDPTGMDVVPTCAQQAGCTIAVKVNVIWDKLANHGKGLTDQQKRAFEKDQMDKARKDFTNSNIDLQVTYTEGTYRVDGNLLPVISGARTDSLNIIVSDTTPDHGAGISKRANGKDLTFISVFELTDSNSLIDSNTTEHEIGHHLLGDTSKPANEGSNFAEDLNIDIRNTLQGWGIKQSAYREGLEQKEYAHPVDPEQNKPKP